MNKNDKKIIDLKKKIEGQKKELGKKEQFKPITHCMLQRDNKKENLNTLSLMYLRFLAINLSQDIKSAKELSFDLNDLILNGFSIEDWLSDVLSKIRIFEYEDKLKSLNILEKKLDKMLSSEKQTELEIDEIAKLLK